MTAGIPGTGIGGIFYLLLALAMPLREALKRDGVRSNWGGVAQQLTIISGMASVLFLEGFCVKAILASFPSLPAARTHAALASVLPGLAWAPFVVLAILVSLVQIARLSRSPRLTRSAWRRK
jgi:hypothetical protein